MKNKIILLLSLLVFAGLVVSVYAATQPQSLPSFALVLPTKSESITCGNGVCESMSFRVNEGEEKQVEIAGKTYNFKLHEMVIKERIYTNPRTGEEDKIYSYKPKITVNGEEITSSREIEEKYGFKPNIVPDSAVTPFVSIEVRETDVNSCAVPDCAVRVESDLYKKWNLVPIYFLHETQLQKGTCKLQDFLVVYGYDSFEKDYVKLHTYGKSANDFENSLIDFERLRGDEKMFVGTPHNSVWVYSLTECELVAELLTLDISTNLLLFLEQVREQGVAKFAPGWNFWVGSTDMQGKSFDEIKGSCTIEKAYTFDASSQSWKVLTTPPGPATNFIFKVKDACMFGVAETTPPEIPE